MKKAVVALLAFVASTTLAAQSQEVPRRPGAMSVDAASLLSEGWSLLARGMYDEAAQRASLALSADSLQAGALSLAVEVEIARVGPLPALAYYEQWLGSRRTEEPYVLRRIARAVLWDVARNMTANIRSDALAALASEGDPDAAALLVAGVNTDAPFDALTMAKMGSQEAAARVINELAASPPNAAALIRVLGSSRRPEAVAPILKYLADLRIDVRVEAAAALGKIGDRRAVSALRPLLDDAYPLVKLQAAAALMLLDDSSGVVVLRGFEESEFDGVKLAAATAMATRPDAAWVDRVRRLTSSGDAIVSVNAATLLAPHDPAAATAVLERHQNDANPAVREAADLALSGEVSADLSTLRAYLRRSDLPLRVRAAIRLMRVAR